MQHHYDREKYFTIINPASGDIREIGINMALGDKILNDITVGEYRVFPSAEEQNPTVRALKFMEKTELVRMIVEIWGPFAVDPRFWLEDAPVEGIEKLIERIEAVIGSQMQEAEKQTAMQDIQAVLQGTQAKMALEPAEESAPRETQHETV